MATKARRHQADTKTFEELTFNQQVLAMNMTALNFRRQLKAHLRRAEEEGRETESVLRIRLGLLEKILADFSPLSISVRFRSQS
jgi:hypothetical protein